MRWSFQSTLPTRGSDRSAKTHPSSSGSISIHAPHEGERQADLAHDARRKCISIHAPHEGERRTCWKGAMADPYFNPRSPRGGATGGAAIPPQTEGISIHAPHEGERPTPAARISIILPFQSTLPTRGSDISTAGSAATVRRFQSTLPTRGSDDMPGGEEWEKIKISIHAPHEGERRIPIYSFAMINGFQSTLPTRGSDKHDAESCALCWYFNPRSPRGGATASPPTIRPASPDFNPRSPRGGATWERRPKAWRRTSDFNPRSPRGGATRCGQIIINPPEISIHAPHEGERRGCAVAPIDHDPISIHAPHEGERRRQLPLALPSSNFNPRSPRGGATSTPVQGHASGTFQSTLPTRGSDISASSPWRT